MKDQLILGRLKRISCKKRVVISLAVKVLTQKKPDQKSSKVKVYYTVKYTLG